MAILIWLLVTIPCGLLFTVLGVYAMRRTKPMWFWSGTSVREDEIADVKAYNRANGIMWICYSLIFWVGAVLGFLNISAAGAVIAIGCLGGIPVLVLVYQRIYNKYKR